MTAESEDNFKEFLDKHSVKAGYHYYYIKEEDQGEGKGDQVEKHSENKYPDFSHMLIVRKEEYRPRCYIRIIIVWNHVGNSADSFSLYRYR